MILLDFVYINSYGGLNLMNLFLDQYTKINHIENNHYLFDSRQDFSQIRHKIYSYTVIKNNEFSRLKFYIKNKNKIKSCFCFGNIPPPLNLNVKTLVYFQNLNILHSNSFKEKIKRKYIAFLLKSRYVFIFQTSYSCISFKKSVSKKELNFKVFPFFNTIKGENKNKRQENSYFYPAAKTKNKNHKLLISSFKLFAKKIKIPVVLYLTITDEEFLNCQEGEATDAPLNLKIINLGSIDFRKVIEKYNEVQYLIFPSIEESFGLPLIEATLNGCKVISSDLPFTHEVIKPSLVFNPTEKSSLVKKLIESLEYTEIEKTTLIVQNKLSNLIEAIIL